MGGDPCAGRLRLARPAVPIWRVGCKDQFLCRVWAGAWVRAIVWLVLVLASSTQARACPLPITAASGTTLCLEQPAQRIISLAPHVTEMLYAIGAQDALVGVIAHSDHPPAAQDLPVIGGHQGLDYEAILRLQPDLVVAWQGGNPEAQLERLQRLGLPLLRTPARQIADVPDALRQLGQATQTLEAAERVSQDVEQRLASLRQRYAQQRSLSGFYEIWPSPLMTVGPGHYISEALQLCGIANVVEQSWGTTPTWNTEAVLRAAPQVLITSAPTQDFVARWQGWPSLPAVQNDALIVLPEDLLVRLGPRFIDGVEYLCTQTQAIRERLAH